MKVLDYTLSAHAKTVIAERGIRQEWFERVLRDPEAVEPDKNDSVLVHALGRIPEHGGRVLRVIYNRSAMPERVVTAFFDRTQRNRL